MCVPACAFKMKRELYKYVKVRVCNVTEERISAHITKPHGKRIQFTK